MLVAPVWLLFSTSLQRVLKINNSETLHLPCNIIMFQMVSKTIILKIMIITWFQIYNYFILFSNKPKNPHPGSVQIYNLIKTIYLNEKHKMNA